MTIRRKLFLLFTPSWISVVITMVLSMAFIGIASLALAEHSGKLGNFTVGSYLQSTSLKNFGPLTRTFLSSIKLTSVFFISFWVFVGFIAYNIIFLLKSSVDESVVFLQQLNYINAKPKLMSRQVITRFILLLLAISLWVLFALVFSWIVLPYILNLISRSIALGHNPIYLIHSYLIFLVVTHIAVILLRFTLLRARINS